MSVHRTGHSMLIGQVLLSFGAASGRQSFIFELVKLIQITRHLSSSQNLSAFEDKA